MMKKIKADPERIIRYLDDWENNGSDLNEADEKVIDIVAHTNIKGIEKDDIFEKLVKDTCKSLNTV